MEINGTSYKPSDLELEPDQVITLPKGAELSQADKTLVTDLPEGSPKGAIALIQYTYNDRKVGQAYLMEKKGTEPASQESEQATAETNPEEPKTSSGIGKASSGRKGGGILAAAGIIAVLALAGGGTGLFIYKKKKEAREVALRREERRRRLKAEGSEEDFERILKQRRNIKRRK